MRAHLGYRISEGQGTGEAGRSRCIAEPQEINMGHLDTLAARPPVRRSEQASRFQDPPNPYMMTGSVLCPEEIVRMGSAVISS